MAEHRLCIGIVDPLFQVHHEERGRRHVVDMQEFAPGRARAPDHHLGRIVEHRLPEAPDQRRQHMAVLGVEVVARAVEVRRHHRAVIGAVLAVVAFAELDAGDLGHRVGLVRGLERAGQQRRLGHRLRRGAGIDAGGTQLQKPPHPGREGLMDDIALDHQVLIDEIGGIAVVGMDPADLRGGKDHHVRAHLLHEAAHRPLVGEVERVPAAGDEFERLSRRPPRLERPQDGAAHHAAMAGDEDPHGAAVTAGAAAASGRCHRAAIAASSSLLQKCRQNREA